MKSKAYHAKLQCTKAQMHKYFIVEISEFTFSISELHFTMKCLYLHWGRIMVVVALGNPIWEVRIRFK